MKVPVILITGFLGSGKTSLLNRLMQARPAAPGKLAIIVNELGDVGIDGDLLPPGMTQQVELPGGCICCVLNEDLDKTLLGLLEREPTLETIVIETTGVAEPMPIAWSLEAQPLAERLRLAAVVTVVDAVNFSDSRPVSPAVDNQVEFADLLLVTKLDLLDGGSGGTAAAALFSAIADLNQDAPVLKAAPSAQAEALWTALADPALDRPRPPAGAAHSHPDHLLQTVSLPIDGVLDVEELTQALEALPANYVRIKAIAEVVDPRTGSTERHWAAIHRVGLRVSSEHIPGPRVPRMVGLGRDIQLSALRECVTTAMLSSSERDGTRSE